MWRRTKEAVANCFIFFAKCGRPNPSVDGDFAGILENLEDEMDDYPVPIGPQLEHYGAAMHQREFLQHRPDAPCNHRRSPPEIVQRVRLALKELCSSFEYRYGSKAVSRVNSASNETRPLFCVRIASDFGFGDDEDDEDDEW